MYENDSFFSLVYPNKSNQAYTSCKLELPEYSRSSDKGMSSGVDLTPSLVGLILFLDKRIIVLLKALSHTSE